MRAVLKTLLALIFCVTAAQPAGAGAWLREKGAGFVSLTTTLRNLDGSWQTENGFYLEYGLAPRLTLGVDVNDIPGLAGHALVFARLPIGPPDRPTKIALELGVGGHQWQGQWGKMLKSTLSVGRGFSSRWGDGWVNIDTAVEVRNLFPDPAFKLDATIGLSAGRRVRPILQIETTYISGSPLIWSVIPGVLIDGAKNTTWQIGVARKTAGQSSLGLKIGLWRQF